MTENRQMLGGHLAAAGTVFLWGITFVSTKILLKSFSPIEILFTRFVIAYLALLVLYPKRIKTKSLQKEILFMAAGLCGITLYFLMENIALTYTLAMNVGIIVSIAPLLTAVFAHFLLHDESLKPRFLVGFLVAMTGIVLIGLNGSLVLKLNPLGDCLAALAALVWAMYSIIMRKISDFGYHAIGCTRRVIFYGIVFMIPALFLLGFNPEISKFAEPVNLLNIAFLGLGASAVCFVSWTWTVRMLGAVKTSFYIYAVPVITMVASALVLREKITTVTCTGAILTLAGLFISERKSFKKDTAQRDDFPTEYKEV